MSRVQKPTGRVKASNVDEIKHVVSPGATVAVAFITTCGALLLKRFFSLSDRRAARLEVAERYENAYRILSYWARQFKQSVASVDALRDDANHGNTYALQRLHELAIEPTPLDALERYVEGVGELPDGD